MSNNSAYALVPELGDLVTFVSDVYTSTTGRIIYRDESLIRIKTTSTTAVEFPLDSETGLFLETLGVREVILHEKRKDPHFSKQIGVVPGEYIEFYTIEGKPIESPQIVTNVIAAPARDVLEFQDGRTMDFAFIGPPSGYGVLRPRAPPEAELPPENNSESNEFLQEELLDVFPEINFDLMPAALVAEIPTEERTSDDTTQREDMFLSLLMDVPVRKQKDPKIMRKQYRISDVLLALKNSVLQRDAQGGIAADPLRTYRVETIQEALAKQAGGEPLAALVPVAAVKKVLYTDDPIGGASFDDVEFDNDFQSMRDLSNAVVAYETTAGSFAQFMHRYMSTVPAYTSKARDPTHFIQVDQDVFRSQLPSDLVQGFPETPAAYKKTRGGVKAIELTNDSLGTIDRRYVRLIGPTRITDHKTKASVLVAPADTADVLGYVLLSDEMTKLRSPIRSRVLLWDIQASEASRAYSKTFYGAYAQTRDAHQVLDAADNTSLVDELYARLRPALSIVNKHTTHVLDSFGLRDLELTDAHMEPIDASLRAGQAAWDLGFKQIQERALQALEKPQTLAVASSTDVGTSGLFTADIRNATGIAAFMATIQRIETAQFESYDLVLANYFLKEASATLGPYWYALAAGHVDRAAELGQVYANEALRLQRNAKTQRELAAELSAVPEINTCPHVHEYEQVSGIRNDDIRMMKFGKFLTKYQAGQKGNYILCNTCNKDLVCKHEVLLFNEYSNRERSEALHKALLLEYAGPVFEGAYICKTCGQKIMDIEYDTHLEFDDEGRPLMGRTVVADAAEEPADDLVLLGEVEASSPFKTEQERLMYANQRILFEHLGAVFDIATYERTVRVALRYVSDVVKTKTDYESIQARLRAAKRPEGPNYETYFNNQVVGLIGALAVLEIQTSAVQIPIPTAGCTLSRSGFPLDGADPAVAGTGALAYVACALAQIKRDVAPWNKVSWTTETSTPKRVQEATRVLTTLLMAVCAIQRPVIDGVTPIYTEILTAARNRKAAAATDATAAPSYADRFPPSFRPLQRAVAVDEQPVGNLSILESQADAQTRESQQYIADRARQLHHSIMNTFHTSGAAQGIVRQNDPCSESVCCFKRVGAIDVTGMGYESLYDAEHPKRKEVEAITSIVGTLRARDPALSNTGTHIYVPWSAPIQAHALPTADSSVYYRLFLKVCYRGRRHGLEHEFDTYLVCRNCGFHMPRELVYMVPAEIGETDARKRQAALTALDKQREELVLAAFQAQGVVIDETTYNELEEKVRERKIIATAAARVQAPFLTLLQQLGDTLPSVLLPQAAADWARLQTGMAGIFEERVAGLRRKGKLESFYIAFDQRTKDAVALLAKDRKYNAQELVGTVMKAIVGHTGIRMLQTMFVTGGNQIANEFTFGAPRARKWFPNIARGLADDLQKIWTHADARTNASYKLMSELTDEDASVKNTVKTVIGRMATWYGPWLRIWQESIRVDPAASFSDLEHSYVLQWSAVSVIQALLTPTGPLYAGLDSSAQVVDILRSWVLNGLVDVRTTLSRHELTPEQVRAQVNARKEQEKNFFIQRMDELDTEMRKLEKFKKEIKMGVWALGNINLSKYNPDAWEALRGQRVQMGIVDEVVGGDVEGQPTAEENANDAAGFYTFGVEDANMGDGALHRAAQDEDETTDMDRPRLNVAC